MKISKHYKPELCIRPDHERERLRAPYLDLKTDRLVATNGHMMAVFPVQVETADLGLDPVRGTPKPRRYVDYAAIIPPERDSDRCVYFNARLLLALAQALGSDGIVEVTVPESAYDPITVRASEDGEFGLLMPCRGPLRSNVEERSDTASPLGGKDDDE